MAKDESSILGVFYIEGRLHRVELLGLCRVDARGAHGMLGEIKEQLDQRVGQLRQLRRLAAHAELAERGAKVWQESRVALQKAEKVLRSLLGKLLQDSRLLL